MQELENEIEEVKQIISKEWSVKLENLSVETRLWHDLGMDGDDGWEFIEVFSKHFQIDMSDFEFDLYFGPESGADPITLLYFLIFKSKRPKRVPITVKDLVNSAKYKRWIKPEAEAIS